MNTEQFPKCSHNLTLTDHHFFNFDIKESLGTYHLLFVQTNQYKLMRFWNYWNSEFWIAHYFTETIKVYDGNNSFRRRIFRTIVVSRQSSLKQVLTQALRAFHITKDPSSFHLTDLYSPDEACLQDPTPVLSLHRKEGKRPAVFLRFKDRDNDKGEVRVYPGKLQVSQAFCTVPVDSSTTVSDLIREALRRFGLQDFNCEDYRCSEVLLDRGGKWNNKIFH